MNATCALLDCNLAELESVQPSEAIIRSIVREFVDVAKDRGTVLDEDEIVEYIITSSKAVGHHYPSMHQDLRSEEHTSELQSRGHLVCRLLLEKTKRACE